MSRNVSPINYKRWNPWIAQDGENLYTMEEGIKRYETHIEKMIEDGYFRKETYAGYKSNIKILREFSGFLVEKDYLKSKPTDGIRPISKWLYKKGRTCIPSSMIGKIAGWCRDKGPHFLFVCYLLYYSFIRPVEMTRLKVRYFNLKGCTVTIPGDDSKNHQTQTAPHVYLEHLLLS